MKTNWVENLFAGAGSIRLYVRWIEFTKTTWRASVGFTNKTPVRIDISTQLGEQPNHQASRLLFWWAPMEGQRGRRAEAMEAAARIRSQLDSPLRLLVAHQQPGITRPTNPSPQARTMDNQDAR